MSQNLILRFKASSLLRMFFSILTFFLVCGAMRDLRLRLWLLAFSNLLLPDILTVTPFRSPPLVRLSLDSDSEAPDLCFNAVSLLVIFLTAARERFLGCQPASSWPMVNVRPYRLINAIDVGASRPGPFDWQLT